MFNDAPTPSNHAHYGYDHIVLKKTGYETDPGSGNYRYLTLKYAGKYFHRHAVARQCVSVPDPLKPILMDLSYNYVCSYQNFEYDMTGKLTLTIDKFGDRIVGFKVFLEGTSKDIPVFEHAADIHFFGDDVDPNDGEGTLFQDIAGNVIFLASYGTNEATTRVKLFANADCKTLDCNLTIPEEFVSGQRYENDFKYRDDLGVYNEPKRVVYDVFWHRDLGPTPASETGVIKGKLVDRSNNIVIKRALVYLNRQVGLIRNKLANESDLAYEIYLRNTTSRIARAPLEEDSTFEFKDVPLFTRMEGSSDAWQGAAYTIEVVYAQADNTFLPGTPVIHYKSKMVHNIAPQDGNDPAVVVGLDGISSIAAKRDVATQLSNISTNNYRAIETNVLQRLAKLESGELPLTAEAEEGVKRAVWAESMAREGARQAEDLIKVMLQGLGSTVTDVLGRLMKNDDTRGAKGKKLVTGAATSKLQSAKADDFKVNPKLSAEEIDQLALDGVQFVMLDTVEKMLSWQSGFTEAVLKVKGADKGTIAKVTRLLNTAAKIVVLIAKQSMGLDPSALFSALRDELIKESINQLAPLLFDNQLRLQLDLPIYGDFRKDLGTLESVPSYCKLTATDLDYSQTKMRLWSRADLARYQADAESSGQYQLELISQGTSVKVLLIYAQATAKIGKTAGSVLGVAGSLGLSQAKIAAEISKEVALFANVSTFAVPAAYVFYSSPKLVKNGVYAAYGEKPITGASLHTVNPPDPASSLPPGLRTELQDAYSRFVNSAGAFATNLQLDEIGKAITASTGTAGFTGAYRSLRQSSGQLSSQIMGVSGNNEGDGTTVSLLIQKELEFTLACDLAYQEFVSLLTTLFSDAYTGKNDQAYILARDEVLRLLGDASKKALDLQGSLTRWIDSHAGVQLRPAIGVAITSISSAGSTKTEISRSGEPFEIKAHVRNLSSLALSNLTVSLSLAVPETVAKINTPSSVQVGTSSLKPYDGQPDGLDEAEAQWTITYVGPVANAGPLIISIAVLESGQTPVSFVSSAATGVLLPDRAATDPDGDRMPTSYEVLVGLDPNRTDADADPDNDGLTNIQEFLLGTDPHKADTDGDGLSDGEEVHGSKNGFRTNPMIADTDGDGILDGTDGQPLNALASTTVAIKEPAVALSAKTLTLSRANSVASVSVRNSGAGVLYWQAELDRPGLVTISPQAPSSGGDGDSLTISLAEPSSAKLLQASETRVVVSDIGGALQDGQELIVRIEAELPPPPPKPKISGITLRSGDRVRINFEGNAGTAIRLEGSVDLKVWTEVYRADTYAGGVLSLTESMTAARPYRFYRAAQ